MGKTLLGEKPHTLKVTQYIIQQSKIDYNIIVEKYIRRGTTNQRFRGNSIAIRLLHTTSISHTSYIGDTIQETVKWY